MERNNSWLKERLEYIYSAYFSDTPRVTPIVILFGRESFQRLGSITLKPQGLTVRPAQQHSLITISSALKDPAIPAFVIDQIIAHELVHYIHGFGSHHRRTLRHPHQGGVIVKEFKRRGLWELYRVYQAWMKLHWLAFLRRHKKDMIVNTQLTTGEELQD